MMLTHMMVCSLLVQPVAAPPPLLQMMYMQHYDCTPRPAVPADLAPAAQQRLSALPDPAPEAETTATMAAPRRSDWGGEPAIPADRRAVRAPPSAPQAIPAQAIGSYFPARPSWWPLFSPAEVGQATFAQYLAAGVKPGVLLPDNPLALLRPGTLWRYRQAVRAGAIPVQTLRRHHRDDFAGRATFAAALGLRPLAGWVMDGWSDNLLANAQGSYLVDHRGHAGLPLPARHNRLGGSSFYLANDALPPGGGFAVRIDPPPPDEHALATVDYPLLALSWRHAGIGFRSTLGGLETSMQGHLLAMGSLLAMPVGVFFDRPWPQVLWRLGTSISWLWLVIGAGMLALLVLAALRRWRRGT